MPPCNILCPCRVSPFLAWGDFHARSRFARSTIPEEKWGTTRSLLEVHMNSFKHVRAFQIELEFGSVSFWGEGKTGVPGEKPLGARERTNNKLNPHMASTPGVENPGHIGGMRALSPLRHPWVRITVCIYINTWRVCQTRVHKSLIGTYWKPCQALFLSLWPK